jgi:adenylyl-sulfate kinase
MSITLLERSRIKHHQPAVLWFTGLSGSGKSTIAQALEQHLLQVCHAHTFLLDGDVIRTGLNRDLDFSPAGRKENIRRLGEVTHLFYNAGLIVLTAFISPYRADRALARSLIPPGGFIEIFVSCPLEICEKRDPKGLYARARLGLIPEFTGISSPYEEPLQPEITLDTSVGSTTACIETVVAFLHSQRILQVD